MTARATSEASSTGPTKPGATSARSGTNAALVEIRFEPSQRSVRVRPGSSLLDAAREARLPIASACGEDGVCARCGLEILAGGDLLAAETERERVIKSSNRIDGRLRLACRVLVVSDLTATAPYW